MIRPTLALIVEDHLADARLLQEALRFCGSGYEAVHVNDPAQAMRWLTARSGYDLQRLVVFTDLDLGTSNGLLLLRMLRSSSTWAHLPVVVVSGTTNRRDVNRAHQCGATAFVPKRQEFAEFAKLIRDLEHVWLGQLRELSVSEAAS